MGYGMSRLAQCGDGARCYDKAASREETIMEHAAAILLQTLFNGDERMLGLLKQQTGRSPEAVAEFIRPWYQAMLMMIKSAEDFDQGPSVPQMSM